MPRNSRTSSGSSTTTIHAPSKNLVVATTSSTRKVARAPTPLKTMLRCQPGSRRRHQRMTMPDWDKVKAQNNDADGEGQPVAAEGELVGEELVATQEVGQPREIGVGGVGGQEKDQER